VGIGKGQQGEIERIRPPPTNSRNRLKSFCEVGYANFRPNAFSAGKRIINGDFGMGGAACMMPSSIKKICSFFQKTEMCKENIYRLCNFKRLEQDIKSRYNPHL